MNAVTPLPTKTIDLSGDDLSLAVMYIKGWRTQMRHRQIKQYIHRGSAVIASHWVAAKRPELFHLNHMPEAERDHTLSGFTSVTDYANSWAGAGDLISELKMSFSQVDDYWQATASHNGCFKAATGKNHQEAAARLYVFCHLDFLVSPDVATFLTTWRTGAVVEPYVRTTVV